MENVIPKYVRPIAKIDDPINKISYWDNAIDAFDEKNYKETIINTLKYINPSLFEGVDTEGDFEIVKMQGSAEINIKVTNDTFSIKAPFLKITDKTNKIALLRKIAEVNFYPLRLAQIHLHNDELVFEYSMPIELSQPHKVYDIIRNVAIYADEYDDMFIEKYNAEFCKNPKYVQLSKEEQNQVWSQITDIFEDYKNYTSFFKEKRWDDFIWDIIVITLLKISNMPYVHGKLRSDLIDNIGRMFNSDLDYHFRVDKSVNYLKELLETPKEQIMKNIYHADTLISLRWRSSEQAISERLKPNLDQVKAYERDESNFNVSYFIQFILLKLIYDYNLEDTYKQAIYQVLEDVSGLEPQEAAPKLIKVFYKLQDGSINQQEEKQKEKKGFFSKLFN